MGFIPYLISCSIAVIILFKKNIIRKYIGKSQFYRALFLMMIGNLTYPTYIQYFIRAIGIGYSSIVIFAHISHNITKISIQDISLYRSYFFYCLYTLLALVSIIWSVGRSETFIKSIEIFIDATLLFFILKTKGNNGVRAITILFIIFSSIMVFSCLIGVLIDPSHFMKKSNSIFGFQIRSYLFGVDAIAGISTLLIIFLLNIPYFKAKWIIYASAGLVVFFAQARTSIAILGIVFAIYMISKGTKPVYSFLFLIVVAALYLNFDLFIMYFNRGAHQHNIDTLNGRRIIWSIASQLIQKRPFLGYGFGAGGMLASSQVQGLNNTHNAYFEIAMGLGYMGVVFVALQAFTVLLKVGRKTIKYKMKAMTFELMCITYWVFRSYTGTGIGGWSSPGYICWLFLMLNVCRKNTFSGFKQQFLNYLEND